jgi:hypothetical protein
VLLPEIAVLDELGDVLAERGLRHPEPVLELSELDV